MDKCDRCAAGTYQEDEGQTACVACTPGYYCKEGASAALPCEGGSYSTATNLTSKEGCTKANAGYFAPIGSTGQKQCNPGTFDPIYPDADRELDRINGTDICELCPPGFYQPEKGAISCVPCADESLGVYCPSEGTSTPTPCPGGTYSDEIGLYSEYQCTSVEAGFYAPSKPNLLELGPASPGGAATHEVGTRVVQRARRSRSSARRAASRVQAGRLTRELRR